MLQLISSFTLPDDTFSNLTIFSPLLICFILTLIGLINCSACHLKPAVVALCAQSSGSRRSLAVRAADFRLCAAPGSGLISVQTDIHSFSSHIWWSNLYVQFISLHCHILEFMGGKCLLMLTQITCSSHLHQSEIQLSIIIWNHVPFCSYYCSKSELMQIWQQAPSKHQRCSILKTLLSLVVFHLPYISLGSNIMSHLLSYGQPFFHNTMK